MGFWGFITTAALVVSLATKIQDAKEMAGLAFSIVTGGGEDAVERALTCSPHILPGTPPPATPPQPVRT